MAAFSRVTPTGWSQGDDSASFARVTPTGWEQQIVTGGTTPYPMKLGTTQVTGLYLGSAPATGIYKGSTQLWP